MLGITGTQVSLHIIQFPSPRVVAAPRVVAITTEKMVGDAAGARVDAPMFGKRKMIKINRITQIRPKGILIPVFDPDH